MADLDLWNLGGPIVPSAAARLAAATAAGVGGVLPLSSLLWLDAAGRVTFPGGAANYRLNVSEANPARGIIADLSNIAGGGLNGALLSFTQNTINNWCIGQAPGVDAFAIYVGRNGAADGAEVMWITSGGNVGIGTTAPGARLQVAGAAGSAVVSLLETGVRNWAIRAGGAVSNIFDIADLTAGATRLVINSAGNVGVGTAEPGVRLHIKSGSGQIMTLESTNARGTGNSYLGIVDATGRKAFIGYGASADNFHIMNEVAGQLGLGVNGVFRFIMDVSGNIAPGSDNGQAFGSPSARWSVLYAGTGTINTSDEREKKWRGGISEEEFAAGVRVLDELGLYQWRDAVEEKGADARIHFGVRAQRVWAIFAEAGLVDPIKKGAPGRTPYAFLCYDAWDEERQPIMKEKKVRKTRPVLVESGTVGEDGAPVMIEKDEPYFETEMVDTGKTEVVRAAGDRFGVRSDQLALFLVAVMDERSRRDKAVMDERLAALEAAAAR